jgi:hypothetical protein
MLWMRDARNISLQHVTVRYSKGYAIYVQGTDGFSFLDSTLERSGVLGLYIGHEDDASSRVRVERSLFRDNSTNALALLGVDGRRQKTLIADNVFERNHALGQWPVAPRYGTGLTGGGQVYLARAEGVRFENNRVVDGFCANCFWHGRLGSGVTGVELGIPGRSTVKDITISDNTEQPRLWNRRQRHNDRGHEHTRVWQPAAWQRRRLSIERREHRLKHHSRLTVSGPSPEGETHFPSEPWPCKTLLVQPYF